MAQVNLSPCKDCPDRKPYCWSSCERYLAAKEEKAKIKAYLNKDRPYALMKLEAWKEYKYNEWKRNGMTIKLDNLSAAIAKNGDIIQHFVAMEELSELQKECSKFMRNEGNHNHLVEEMADVYIILEELKLMHNVTDIEMQIWLDIKNDRLKQANSRK